MVLSDGTTPASRDFPKSRAVKPLPSKARSPNSAAGKPGSGVAGGRGGPFQNERHQPADPPAVVEIVSFEVTALPPGVTLAGENTHVLWAGRLDPKHDRFTAFAKAPIWGLTEMV